MKNILDHKNDKKIIVDANRIAQNKKRIFEEIADTETKIYPLRQNNIIYVSFSAAAAILLLFFITNNTPSTLDLSNQKMLSKNNNIETTYDLKNQYLASLDDYDYSEDEIIQAITLDEETTSEDNQYIDYLITEDIDEDLLIEELL